mmetsp:Transcript_19531/g.44895  ORF Transcript_19531/g.44895 Transcript_19531/m.44895 type:complete len:255 (-) Transcript_19531:1324-2088(-)
MNLGQSGPLCARASLAFQRLRTTLLLPFPTAPPLASIPTCTRSTRQSASKRRFPRLRARSRSFRSQVSTWLTRYGTPRLQGVQRGRISRKAWHERCRSSLPGKRWPRSLLSLQMLSSTHTRQHISSVRWTRLRGCSTCGLQMCRIVQYCKRTPSSARTRARRMKRQLRRRRFLLTGARCHGRFLRNSRRREYRHGHTRKLKQRWRNFARAATGCCSTRSRPTTRCSQLRPRRACAATLPSRSLRRPRTTLSSTA